MADHLLYPRVLAEILHKRPVQFTPIDGDHLHLQDLPDRRPRVKDLDIDLGSEDFVPDHIIEEPRRVLEALHQGFNLFYPTFLQLDQLVRPLEHSPPFHCPRGKSDPADPGKPNLLMS